MWGWLPGRLLSGPLYGSGPAGGCSSRKAGQPLVLWFPACVVGAGVVGCLVFGVEDTPVCWWAAAAVVVVVVGWLVGASVRAWCVWGWHAVGVLGQCALVA